MKQKSSFIAGIFLVLMGVAAYFGYDYYIDNYIGNTNNIANKYLYIKKNTPYDSLVAQLKSQNLLINEATFREVARSEGYDRSPVRAGRFEISGGMGNKSLVRLLKVGKQSPVRVSFHNKRTMAEVAGYLGRVLQPDSLAFLATFTDAPYLKTKGYTTETVMTAFMSNTYEIFWTSEPADVLARMIKEHDRFWNADRLAKAKALGLTPVQAYTLASIVEKETLADVEKQRIAGVYWNRLQRGMKLEADPTVVFATGQFDLRRILKEHLAVDSPYNTYMYTGLPPGPIYMPSPKTIDFALSLEKHNYIFFCAAPDNSGTHRFAETLAQHNGNANEYHKWLNTQGRLANQK